MERLGIQSIWTNVKSGLRMLWLNGSEADATFSKMTGSCVLLDRNKLYAAECSRKRNFFCQREEGEMACATESLSWPDAVQHCRDLNSSLLQSKVIPLNKEESCAVSSAGLWVGAELVKKARSYGPYTVLEVPKTFSNQCPEDHSHHQSKCAALKINGTSVTCTQVHCEEKHPYICYEPSSIETGPVIAPLVPVTTLVNRSVTLQCNASGNPTPTNSNYSWYFKGSKVANGSTLKLTKVTKEQAGQYTCTVAVQSSQSQKKLTASRDITLTVYFPPQSATQHGDIQLVYSTLYQEINFTVTVLANPNTVIFTWFKQNIRNGNYYEIAGDDSKYVINSRNLQSSLFISNLSASEFTNYSVKADNSVYEGSYFFFQLMPKGCPTVPQLDQVSSTAETIRITWRPGRDGGYPQTITLTLCYDTECQVVDQRRTPEKNQQSVTHVDSLPSSRCFSLTLEASNEHKENEKSKGCSVQTRQHDVCTKERQMTCEKEFTVMYHSKIAVLRWDQPEKQGYDRQVVEQWQGAARKHQLCTVSQYCLLIEVPLDLVCLRVDIKTGEWYMFRLVHYLKGKPVSILTANEIVSRDKTAEILGYCGFVASLCTLFIITSMLLLRERVPLTKPTTSEADKSSSSSEMAAIQHEADKSSSSVEMADFQNDNANDTKECPTE